MGFGKLIFGFFQIFCGVYTILLFAGIIKTDDKNEKFSALKNKYGKLFIVFGIIMVISGIIGLF